MSLFLFQPDRKSGTYHLLNGSVNVLVSDSSDPEKLGTDALDFENQLTNVERPLITDLIPWLEGHGYSQVGLDNSIQTYGLNAPKPAPLPPKSKQDKSIESTP